MHLHEADLRAERAWMKKTFGKVRGRSLIVIFMLNVNNEGVL